MKARLSDCPEGRHADRLTRPVSFLDQPVAEPLAGSHLAGDVGETVPWRNIHRYESGHDDGRSDRWRPMAIHSLNLRPPKNREFVRRRLAFKGIQHRRIGRRFNYEMRSEPIRMRVHCDPSCCARHHHYAVDAFLRTRAKPVKTILAGMSMGGYLAPHAAAFVDRIDDVTAFNTFFDIGEIADGIVRMAAAPKRGPARTSSGPWTTLDRPWELPTSNQPAGPTNSRPWQPESRNRR